MNSGAGVSARLNCQLLTQVRKQMLYIGCYAGLSDNIHHLRPSMLPSISQRRSVQHQHAHMGSTKSTRNMLALHNYCSAAAALFVTSNRSVHGPDWMKILALGLEMLNVSLHASHYSAHLNIFLVQPSNVINHGVIHVQPVSGCRIQSSDLSQLCQQDLAVCHFQNLDNSTLCCLTKVELQMLSRQDGTCQQASDCYAIY